MKKPLWMLVLIGSGTAMLTAALGFGVLTLLTPKSSSNSSVAQPANNNRMVGRWNGVSENSGMGITTPPLALIFTSGGRLIIIPKKGSVASEVGKYEYIQDSSGDKVLFENEVSENNYTSVMTFTPDGKLVMDLVNEGANNRVVGKLLFQKVSNDSTIPSGIQVLDSNAVRIRGIQSEAQMYAGIPNKNQQDFHIKNNRFASTYSEMAAGIPSETKNYSYSINIIDKFTVQHNAIPKKDDLKTFISGVFLTQPRGSSGYTYYYSVCESNQPIRTPPPRIITINGQSPQCPSGYTSILSRFRYK